MPYDSQGYSYSKKPAAMGGPKAPKPAGKGKMGAGKQPSGKGKSGMTKGTSRATNPKGRFG